MRFQQQDRVSNRKSHAVSSFQSRFCLDQRAAAALRPISARRSLVRLFARALPPSFPAFFPILESSSLVSLLDRASPAVRAISSRFSGVSASLRAFPPNLPSATAWGFLRRPINNSVALSTFSYFDQFYTCLTNLTSSTIIILMMS
jgi:hypothetical protein